MHAGCRRTDHVEISSAAVPQLRQLLTMCVRMERYCEGSLACDFESGLLTVIVRRASVSVRSSPCRRP
ncbi:DUF6508 domain-containing protein [Aestuariivirga sp.]|uniref:DUF6508 domain-containing protein n=1 Tax=Aestuariivirga sp. TaxID=2650926 RepID=UPI00345A8E84